MTGYDLHPEALDDFEEIRWFIAEESPDAADRIVTEIFDAIRALVPFPHQGFRRPNITSRLLRFKTVREYVVAYAPETWSLPCCEVASRGRGRVRGWATQPGCWSHVEAISTKAASQGHSCRVAASTSAPLGQTRAPQSESRATRLKYYPYRPPSPIHTTPAKITPTAIAFAIVIFSLKNNFDHTIAKT